MTGDDDDRELFERALASMSPAEVYRGKFGGGGDDAPAEERPEDATSREELQRLREQREMENAFTGVERIDRGKYRVPPPRVDVDADPDALRAEFEAALAPPESAPTPPPPPSIAADAPADVHTLNLRGMEPDDALSKLGLFVDLASKDRRGLIRLRIGSNPALLKAVRDWFEGPGLTYVAEIELAQAHADAAIFARIRDTNPS